MAAKDSRFELRLTSQERALGDEIAKKRGLDNFSELVRVLLEEEKSRVDGTAPPPDAIAAALKELSKLASKQAGKLNSARQESKTRRRSDGVKD